MKDFVNQPRYCRMSVIQLQIARQISAHPPVNSTYELVHRFLLIENQTLQTSPAISPAAPRASIPTIFCFRLWIEPSHSPVRTPHSVVAIAGKVLSTPSGSRVRSYRWPIMSLRSRYAARLALG